MRSLGEATFKTWIYYFNVALIVEVLINGAGIVGEENWEKIYEVNIKGVHYGILQGFKHMKNGGVVVNISSTAGHNGKILVKQSEFT